MTQEIEILIVKFVNRNISVDEEKVLNDWLNNPVNEQVFKDYVQIHYAITCKSINDLYLKQSKEKLILNEEDKEITASRTNTLLVTKSFSIKPYIKYAAAVIIIGALTTFFMLREGTSVIGTKANKITSIKNESIIQPGTNKAILTLENGSEVELKEDKPYEGIGVKSTGSEIVYKTEKEKDQVEVQYNYLTIPRGGYFFVQLSDGTKVWLNSESQIKFPKYFVSGKAREVELIYGEAYFEVSPSSQHDGSTFKVISSAQDVEVLGTEFNIKAYKDEDNVYTTLVEGRVSINTGQGENHLKPHQQSVVSKESKDISIQYVDVDSEISWKNGVFSFKGKSLKEIMKTISRWYDVNVVFENKDLETIKFKGVIDKNREIEEILSIMKSNTINNYEIDENTIIIK